MHVTCVCACIHVCVCVCVCVCMCVCVVCMHVCGVLKKSTMTNISGERWWLRGLQPPPPSQTLTNRGAESPPPQLLGIHCMPEHLNYTAPHSEMAEASVILPVVLISNLNKDNS